MFLNSANPMIKKRANLQIFEIMEKYLKLIIYQCEKLDRVINLLNLIVPIAQGTILKGFPEGCQGTIMSCLRGAGRKAWGGKGHGLAHSPVFTKTF